MEQRARAGVLPEAREPGQGVWGAGSGREPGGIKVSSLGGREVLLPQQKGKKTSEELSLCGSPSHLALQPLQRRGLKARL